MVLGISADSVESHAKFRRKYKLPYRLLADVGHVVSSRYGVWREKRMFGRLFDGIARTTFLVDAGGTIARVFEEIDTAGHGTEVANAVAALPR